MPLYCSAISGSFQGKVVFQKCFACNFFFVIRQDEVQHTDCAIIHDRGNQKTCFHCIPTFWCYYIFFLLVHRVCRKICVFVNCMAAKFLTKISGVKFIILSYNGYLFYSKFTVKQNYCTSISIIIDVLSEMIYFTDIEWKLEVNG